jgi:hypothetical protein
MRRFDRHVPAAAPSSRQKTPEQIAQKVRRITRVCVTTGLSAAVIGGALQLASSHTLHKMSVFLFGCAVGCGAAYLNILLQKRLAKRDRRSDHS